MQTQGFSMLPSQMIKISRNVFFSFFNAVGGYAWWVPRELSFDNPGIFQICFDWSELSTLGIHVWICHSKCFKVFGFTKVTDEEIQLISSTKADDFFPINMCEQQKSFLWHRDLKLHYHMLFWQLSLTLAGTFSYIGPNPFTELVIAYQIFALPQCL